jgi:hypothetical protein
MEDVHKWIQVSVEQYSLPPVDLRKFLIDGATLTLMSEAEFKTRSPEVSIPYLDEPSSTTGTSHVSILTYIPHPIYDPDEKTWNRFKFWRKKGETKKETTLI